MNFSACHDPFWFSVLLIKGLLTGTLKGEELGPSAEMLFSELPGPEMLLRLGEWSDVTSVQWIKKNGEN